MLSVSNFLRHCLSKVLHGQTEKNRLDKWTTRWPQNWLICQAQRIVISHKTSSWRFVCSGVPQGLMLGPVLLNSTIDYLNNGTEGSFGMFVDDMKLWSSDWCTSVMLPLRGTLTVCRNELREASWSSTKENAQFCSWENSLVQQYRFGQSDWKAAWQERTWVSWWTQS